LSPRKDIISLVNEVWQQTKCAVQNPEGILCAAQYPQNDQYGVQYLGHDLYDAQFGRYVFCGCGVQSLEQDPRGASSVILPLSISMTSDLQ
jgi:hypothetical protein